MVKIYVTFLKLILYHLFSQFCYENSLSNVSFDLITSNKNFKMIHG